MFCVLAKAIRIQETANWTGHSRFIKDFLPLCSNNISDLLRRNFLLYETCLSPAKSTAGTAEYNFTQPRKLNCHAMTW